MQNIFEFEPRKEDNAIKTFSVNNIKAIAYKRYRSNICDKNKIITLINNL